MIAGEQHLVTIEQNLVATRVPRGGNDLEFVIDARWIGSLDHALDASSGGALRFMHDTRAVEMRGEFRVIGDVIAMGEEHEANAAHLLDALYQRIVEARRIDQHVPAALLWPHDQVRPGPEARFGREAAKIDVVDDVRGKRFNAGPGAAARHSPNRRGWTCAQGHERAVHFARILWLMVDARLASMIVETRGGNLAAGVAVDTTGVDVEIAFNVFG